MASSQIVQDEDFDVTASGAGDETLFTFSGKGILKELRIRIKTNSSNVDNFTLTIDGTDYDYQNTGSFIDIREPIMCDETIVVKMAFNGAATANTEYRYIYHAGN